MKVSICITVLNEEKSIKNLLNSLIQQSQKPDEIIVIDGGSSDSTISLIKSLQKKYLFLKLKVVKKANRSQGRNIGVKLARNEIVAITDADCVADRNWLKNITNPFKDKKVGIVAGFYHMTAGNSWQKALIPFISVAPSAFNKNFLPSTRSIAFRRGVWQKIGGFPESKDNRAEDTDFNYKAILLKVKIVRVKDALVYWQVPQNIFDSLKKFFNYAKWDIKSGIWWHPIQRFKSHNIKVLTVFGRYIFLAIFLILGLNDSPFLAFFVFFFSSYLIWSIYKTRKAVRLWRDRIFVPIIQLASDFSVMFGFLNGLWDILVT